ncbi:hypothetical protein FRC17_002908 [Serendipita sp. 399]|nr:hypothetical protein FRC17_002908 [Serendipita sp. 399]
MSGLGKSKKRGGGQKSAIERTSTPQVDIDQPSGSLSPQDEEEYEAAQRVGGSVTSVTQRAQGPSQSAGILPIPTTLPSQIGATGIFNRPTDLRQEVGPSGPRRSETPRDETSLPIEARRSASPADRRARQERPGEPEQTIQEERRSPSRGSNRVGSRRAERSPAPAERVGQLISRPWGPVEDDQGKGKGPAEPIGVSQPIRRERRNRRREHILAVIE